MSPSTFEAYAQAVRARLKHYEWELEEDERLRGDILDAWNHGLAVETCAREIISDRVQSEWGC